MDLSNKAADNIRILAASMVEKAKSGHPGGPMGGADFVQVLYSEFLNFDPKDMTWAHRDRFYLDAGHMSPMLYGVLGLFGNYSMDELKNFRQWGSPTPGHPELDVARGVENTSGPLGLGHAFGIGSAIAERFMAARFGETIAHKTYIYISDGGIQEEISQGGGRIAGHLGLGNVIMFYDANDIQLSTMVDVVTGEDTAKKYEAWGWHVMTISGNDHNQIRHAIQEGIDETDRPTLMIGKTTMGKGALTETGDSFEGQVSTHGQPLSKAGASMNDTIKNLGGDPENPFQIFSDVAEHIEKVKNLKHKIALKRKSDYQNWSDENSELAAIHHSWLSGATPKIDWASITQKPNVATRNSSATVLSHFADSVGNMIVASADLANSDKTEAFLKKNKEFQRNDFNGAFLQAGVSELTMSALCTGMALHGGIIPVCATFFAFSDYMKPAIRVAALMEQQVIFIWTHDAFRVGEDGPTHQPIEQEAQIRLMEKLKNHSGNNAFLALRPADADETTIAWKMALENTNSPSGLILSRQNVESLTAMGDSRFEEAKSAEFGGYIVQNSVGTPDVVLVGNGSEVSTLLAGAKKISEEKNLKVRVVSVPSEGVFRNQSADYQESTLPADIPTFGLTAGLPVNLEGLVGKNGLVAGLDHFGYSAPYTVLDEKFGFTGDHVYRKVIEFLGR
jgi:transketolase